MKFWIAIIPLLLLQAPAFAETAGTGCDSSVSRDLPPLTVTEANALLSGLGVEVKEARQAPVNGMWELVLEKEGQRSFAYLDFEKKHLMPGPVFDLASKQLVGGAARPLTPAKADVAAITLADSIVMGNPAGKTRLFVFTDPECPYCATLHWELVKLTEMMPELSIYVKMFPLKMHAHAFDKARVILGMKSLQMLDQNFAGEPLPPPGPMDSAQPVERSIKLGESLGVSSTPTLILPDGRVLPGVKSAAEIKKLLTIGAM